MTFASTMVLAGVGLLLLGAAAARADGATWPYAGVRTNGVFEVRDYPAFTVMETPLPPDGDGSFMRLFHYLRGRNAAQQKIAMTAPVLISGAESNRTMAFILPAPMKADTAPKPSDGGLTLRNCPAGRWAVLRYHGGRNASLEAKSLAQLLAWMKGQKLTALSGPVYGYFDPPWILPPWRHNEVMLRTVGQTN